MSGNKIIEPSILEELASRLRRPKSGKKFSQGKLICEDRRFIEFQTPLYYL